MKLVVGRPCANNESENLFSQAAATETRTDVRQIKCNAVNNGQFVSVESTNSFIQGWWATMTQCFNR
jgi:hypothetical protein